MLICLYVYMYICKDVYLYNISISVSASRSICLHACMRACVYGCMCIHTEMCVYIYIWFYMHIYIYTYIYIQYIHTHILCFVYVCSHTCVDLLMHAFSICMVHAVYLLIQRSTLLSWGPQAYAKASREHRESLTKPMLNGDFLEQRASPKALILVP